MTTSDNAPAYLRHGHSFAADCAIDARRYGQRDRKAYSADAWERILKRHDKAMAKLRAAEIGAWPRLPSPRPHGEITATELALIASHEPVRQQRQAICGAAREAGTACYKRSSPYRANGAAKRRGLSPREQAAEIAAQHKAATVAVKRLAREARRLDGMPGRRIRHLAKILEVYLAIIDKRRDDDGLPDLHYLGQLAKA